MDKTAFIRANTEAMTPPHVPEIFLHLADEAHALWRKTEEELAEIGLEPPFWAFAWAGGQGLARYVLDRTDCVSGRRVLDFATGSGLVAIAAAKAGASEVTASDIDPFCETAVALNAGLNTVDIDYDGRDLVGMALPAIDVLLAGDVFFDRAMSARLVPWFAELAKSGVDILVGDPGRSYLPRERLTLLDVYEVPVTRALEDAEVKKTSVWRFI
ncbi:methyltransferase [Oricola sp.]|uniref:class I SAM-dependent methyltransferase n=1 Tax=Oricola sp. TaxID=1979950 RepID=UPI00320BC89E|nr:methyltransferase [Oricola sp.]